MSHERAVPLPPGSEMLTYSVRQIFRHVICSWHYARVRVDRVARALDLEAGFTATAGKSGLKRATQLYAVAESLSKESGHPHRDRALQLYERSGGILSRTMAAGGGDAQRGR